MATPKKSPPPLPPRQSSAQSLLSYFDAPPPYDSIVHSKDVAAGPWETQDPRSSSMQSLAPSENNEQNERRRLLMIYIHGFMGNETSFRSFPPHVHHLLTVLLAETHVVHTKIYPRYRSKRNISFARDDFSAWLKPHEDPKTDVVLLGHSMGGLLAAEVVLMPPAPPASRPLKHRVLGSVNFDVPYLGMHPGVIKSGLASIFSPAEQPRDETLSPELTPVASNDGMSPISPSLSARSDTLWAPDHNDPNYNTPFPNDVQLPVRKGWRSAWHFVNKHSGELGKATKQLVSSHMEFGGAMANYGELKVRYARIRALEEADGAVRKSVVQDGGTPPRARFVNYYTASTGKPKKQKQPKSTLSLDTNRSQGSLASSPTVANESQANLTPQLTLAHWSQSSTSARSSVHQHSQAGLTATPTSIEAHGETVSADASQTPSPRTSLEEYKDDGTMLQNLDPEPYEASDEDWNDAAETLTIDDPNVTDDKNASIVETGSLAESASLASTLSRSYSLPPIPDPPSAPPPLDVSYIEDTDTRKLFEKEHTRAVKAHEKAVKDRQKASNDRAKLEEKHKRNSGKYAEIARKEALKAEQKAEADRVKAEKKAEAERVKEVATQAKLGKKKAENEMTQQQKEELRLEQERQRLEAEARRMRGEEEPPQQPTQEEVPDTPISDAADEAAPAESMRPPMASMQSREDHQPRTASQDTSREAAAPPPKDRMFCLLPPKDSNGERDPCWVRVFMRNVDEVGAHCGLFFVDERYERLVGDVAERVEEWVKEAGSDRAAPRAQ